MAQAIDSLYVTLGLDITEFERDFAAADKKFQSAANKLQGNARLAKLKMEVDMAGFDAADKSVAALNARMIGLNRVYGEQYKLVQVTKTAWQQAAAKYGETSQQSQRLESRYLREQKALKDLEMQMKRTTTARTGEKKEIADQILALGKYGALAYASERIAQSILDVGKASLKLAIDAQSAEKMFSLYLESAAGQARQWSMEISKTLGLDDVVVRKNTAQFFMMISNMGLAREQTLEMSKGLVELGYDLAALNKIPVEQVFEKLSAALRGEFDPLESLGVTLNETTVKSYAYSKGIAKMGEQLTVTQKALATYAAIMEQTAQAQGYLAASSDGPSQMMERIKVNVTKLEREIGNKLLPTYEKLLKTTLELMEADQPKSNYILNYFGDLARMAKSAYQEQEKLKGLPAGSSQEQLSPKEDLAAQKKKAAEEEKLARDRARIESEKNAKILADTIKVTDEINAINQSAFATEMMQVMRRVEEYRKAGIAEIDIAKFITSKETEARRVQLESQRRMMTEIYGTELDKRLLQIDEAKQSYIKAGFDEAKAREMVEKQKLKTIKDYSKQAGDAIRSALMGGWGDVVNAVKDALDAGENGYAAMEKALRLSERNMRNEKQALDMVAGRVGLTPQERQMIVPQTPMQQLNQTRTDVFGQSYTDSLNRFVQQLEVVGNTMQTKWVDTQQQPSNVNLNVTVDVQGASMDDQQAADRIAAIITPKIEQAIAGNNYGY